MNNKKIAVVLPIYKKYHLQPKEAKYTKRSLGVQKFPTIIRNTELIHEKIIAKPSK